MPKKRYLIIPLGLVSMLLGSLLISNMILAQTNGSYDPWLDYNEDGIIDANDLSPLGQSYGSSGDATKNVVVTNWPQEVELFPETWFLKSSILASGGNYRYDLIEEDTPYLPYSRSIDYIPSTTINSTHYTIVYNRTFVYQKLPEHPYQILGMPSIYVPFNLTNNPDLPDWYLIEVFAYLGKISFNGDWTSLKYLGYRGYYFTGLHAYTTVHYQIGNIASPLNYTINMYERLAIKICAQGRTDKGTTGIHLELLSTDDTHAMIRIPVIENL